MYNFFQPVSNLSVFAIHTHSLFSKMHIKPQTFILSCLFLLATAGLPAHAEPLSTFVSIPPQKWLVEQVGGDLVNTQILLDKGQDPHTYQPSPEKITALFRSRLYFTIGMNFEREITRKITTKQGTGIQLIDTTPGIKKIPITSSDAHHHHHHEGHHGETEQSQKHTDPHIWLDPRNGKIMAASIAEALATADPKNATIYQQNYKKLNERLTRLHKELEQQLAPFQGATFYVFHPAFGYFAHAYGLHQKAVETEGKAPSPKQLYALVKQAKADKVKVLFVQPQFDKKNASTVAQAIKGELVVLNPLTENIEQNLRQMVNAIQTALTSDTTRRD
jgi:zinc transport system substrate-binding protein